MSAEFVIRALRLDERAAWEPLLKGYLDFLQNDAAEGDLRRHLVAAA